MTPTVEPGNGPRIAAFEARMAGPLAGLIRKHGGIPVEAPALREVPLGGSPEVLDFARRLVADEFDIVIFLTGVGARYLLEEVQEQTPRDAFIEALRRVKVVARGPKPLAVLRDWGVEAFLTVPEPNTWHEVLSTIDARLPVAGLRVALQEYGQPNPELVEALQSRGALVTRVPVYRWALPEDTGPLRSALRAIAEGQVEAVLFTSAQQVVHVLQVAEEEGIGDQVRDAMAGPVVLGSIGPTTTEALRSQRLEPAVVPEHPKMGHLVAAVADRLRRGTVPAVPIDRQEPARDPLHDSPFLRACRREPTAVTPIWLMRQAGRYMAEYRDLRSRVGFLELCKTPELATEVTVHAAERLGVDAAILFADILLILEPLGFALEFSKGEGPIIHNPIRQAADVDRVRPLASPEPLDFVTRAVRMIRDALRPDLPLIGFAGGPFTLACYAIEGGASRHYERAKVFLYRDPGAWDALMERLVDATLLYLNAQIAAGAQAIQIFDSWVGTLAPEDYRQSVQPHMQRLFAGLPQAVPTIHFGADTGSLLELQRDAGGHVIGLDWRVELDRAWERLGPGVAVQGNLDPAVLLGPVPEIRRRARQILDRAAGRPGHIFNLGHGILPQTPVENVLALVDEVHDAARRA
jgi:uroporphyrinogen decarboxylase